jgi:hypothetical protein
MLRKVIRRGHEIAKEAVDGPLLEGSEYLQFCGKKVYVEFTAHMAPRGPIWLHANVEVHIESRWASQNAGNIDVH